MSEEVKDECKDPARHHLHLCELRKQGRKEEVAALMVDAGHTCHNCNGVARNALDLCNPSSFAKI